MTKIPPPGGGGGESPFLNMLDTTNNQLSVLQNTDRERSASAGDISTLEKTLTKNNKRPLESPEKTKKAKKQQTLTTYWLSKPTAIANKSSNRFEGLPVDEPGIEFQNEIAKKEPKPPPIFVSKVDNIQPLKDLLEEIAQNNYEIRILREDELKIQSATIETYSTITKALEEKNTEFHTFRPKQERLFNVVLKGMHSSTSLVEIKEEIEILGHDVVNISNIKQRLTKRPLPMFYVNLKPKDNNKDIYKCDVLLHSKIKFEPPRKKREIPQCSKCQRYGHTKSYCHHSPRCVKCTGNHQTSDCLRSTKSQDVQCTLCTGNHPANYKGCTVYKDLQLKMYPPLRTRQTNVQANKESAPKGTYAQILKNSSHNNPQCSDETIQPSPTPQQPNDLTDLKNMMKVFMEQMSTMMNLLTTVITKLFNGSAN